jgi:hypothetical protein
MSTHYEIFLRPVGHNVTSDDVAADVERASGTTIRLLKSAPEIEYGGRMDTAVVEMFVEHDFEDDEDLPFSSHQYMVQFRDFGQDLHREKQTMWRVYRSLSETGRYNLFATLDLQVRADPQD